MAWPTTGGQAVMSNSSAVKAGIRNAIDGVFAKIRAAWADGNAAQFAEVFSEDAIFVPFNGARLVGREAIKQFHERPFATELRGSTLDVNLVDVRAVTEGIYLISTRGGPTRPGQESGAQGTQSHIIQRLEDRWAVVFFQNTPVLPARVS
jgi:uncharacterized protein (TIGR02246 family)